VDRCGRKVFEQHTTYGFGDRAPDAICELRSWATPEDGSATSGHRKDSSSRGLKEVGQGKEQRKTLSEEFLRRPALKFDE
jgi:hypothetical protein